MGICSQTKICEKCQKPFSPLIKSFTKCHSCWYDLQRKCRLCGEVINKLPKNYIYCNSCYFTKIFIKNK